MGESVSEDEALSDEPTDQPLTVARLSLLRLTADTFPVVPLVERRAPAMRDLDLLPTGKDPLHSVLVPTAFR